MSNVYVITFTAPDDTTVTKAFTSGRKAVEFLMAMKLSNVSKYIVSEPSEIGKPVEKEFLHREMYNALLIGLGIVGFADSTPFVIEKTKLNPAPLEGYEDIW